VFMESGVGSHCRCGPVGKLPFEHVVPQSRDPFCMFTNEGVQMEMYCVLQ